MNTQPTDNAIHESGHAVAAFYLGLKSLFVTAQPGSDHRGEWAGRIQFYPAEYDALELEKKRLIGVAGSIAQIIARGETPEFQAVIDGMSDTDLEPCRECGEAVFMRAIDEVAALMRDPDFWADVLEMAACLDRDAGWVSGWFRERLEALG